jgi:phosphoribosylformylglycinamidine synthase
MPGPAQPIINGFARAFGKDEPAGSGVGTERWEWLKPILFTGGVGQIHDEHIVKGKPEPSMLVVKLGGPAYRIGMGGGAASSMVQGENKVCRWTCTRVTLCYV